MPAKGSYLLCIELIESRTIKVGALGEIDFKQGRYIYVGSALNSLYPRLDRHLKHSIGEHDVTHWHIDYLLREPEASIKTIYYTDNGEKIECELASTVSVNGSPILKFGCSDCRCKSHLYKVSSFEFVEKMGLRKYP